MKTICYVDGFNLYHAIRRSCYKWLDPSKLLAVLLPDCDIELIKYFTADIKVRNGDDTPRLRQQAFYRALKTIPNLEMIKGQFQMHTKPMPLARCYSYHVESVEVIKTVEKGSDVNLASHLIVDGMRGLYEKAYVLSNDSDYFEPIRLLTEEIGLFVGVINPHGYERRSGKLLKVASDFKQVQSQHLAESQFPDQLQGKRGKITRPEAWAPTQQSTA